MVGKFNSSVLGIISSKHLWSDPQGVKTIGGFGRQVEEFSRHFGKLVLIVPFEQRSAPAPGYIIQIENLEIVPLPYHSGTGIQGKINSLIKMPGMTRKIWQAYGRCDILSYWMSGYVGTIGLLIHKFRQSKPGFAIIGTDWPDRILQTKNTRLRREMAKIIAFLVPRLIRDMPVFAVGHLSQKYSRLGPFIHFDVQTTLAEKDIRQDNETELTQPLRLIYVGRLAIEKGLIYLLEAIHLCQLNGINLDLTLVGDGDERDALEKLVIRYDLQNHIHFAGYLPLGEELWEKYHQADVFILPSLSEGMPKVLIEAMANGLVIIATRVGGIPTLIENSSNGLLIESRSPESIAGAIEKIIKEPRACKQLAHNALVTAREYTIEKRTRQLVDQLGEDLQKLGW